MGVCNGYGIAVFGKSSRYFGRAVYNRGAFYIKTPLPTFKAFLTLHLDDFVFEPTDNIIVALFAELLRLLHISHC